MRIPALLLLVIFTFQIFDIPPVGNKPNPHTCCGRSICQCRHAPGARCPFRHGLPEDSMQEANSGHKSCHLDKTKGTVETKKMADASPIKGFAFTKAPCASDTPKTVLPEYSKDFLFPSASDHFVLTRQGTVPIFSAKTLLFLREQGIERPPRIF